MSTLQNDSGEILHEGVGVTLKQREETSAHTAESSGAVPSVRRGVIGVVAKSSDENVVREFFELFKTPWEFVQPGRSYDVVPVSYTHLPLPTTPYV